MFWHILFHFISPGILRNPEFGEPFWHSLSQWNTPSGPKNKQKTQLYFYSERKEELQLLRSGSYQIGVKNSCKLFPVLFVFFQTISIYRYFFPLNISKLTTNNNINFVVTVSWTSAIQKKRNYNRKYNGNPAFVQHGDIFINRWGCSILFN